jgi:hypothetical protein
VVLRHRRERLETIQWELWRGRCCQKGPISASGIQLAERDWQSPSTGSMVSDSMGHIWTRYRKRHRAMFRCSLPSHNIGLFSREPQSHQVKVRSSSGAEQSRRRFFGRQCPESRAHKERENFEPAMSWRPTSHTQFSCVAALGRKESIDGRGWCCARNRGGRCGRQPYC